MKDGFVLTALKRRKLPQIKDRAGGGVWRGTHRAAEAS